MARSAGKTGITESGWALTNEMRAWARDKVPNVNIEYELECFIDYWKGNGKKMCDWDATFRNWMRRAPEFAGRNRNTRFVATVEMPFVGGERSPGPPVQLRDHPLFRGIKKAQ